MEETNTPVTTHEKKSNGMAMIGAVVLLLAVGVGVFAVTSMQNKSSAQDANQSPTPAMMAEETPEVAGEQKMKGYTLGDVAAHATETDCWMAIDGKVYNVTDFVSKHPGGKAILKGCGTDASVLFNERPTNNKGPHPEQAREMLTSLYIGELQK